MVLCAATALPAAACSSAFLAASASGPANAAAGESAPANIIHNRDFDFSMRSSSGRLAAGCEEP
jgi:phage-related minor tail protein